MLARFAGLHQRQGFHQLVQRAESARHHDVGAGEFDEHHLAREKMLEGLADVLVVVADLFVRQLDVQPDAGRFAVERALVGGLHDAGAAAGDDRKSGIGKQARDLLGKLVIGLSGLGARAAEDAHGRVDLVKPVGGRNKL